MFMLVHMRRCQRLQEKRDLAESIEDARIFASSRQIDPNSSTGILSTNPAGSTMMMKPLDQMSVASSHQSAASSMLPVKQPLPSVTGSVQQVPRVIVGFS